VTSNKDRFFYLLVKFMLFTPRIVVVVVVVVVVGRSWQATNVLQPVDLLYRPLLDVPILRYYMPPRIPTRSAL
jgi:hypothetical protein